MKDAAPAPVEWVGLPPDVIGRLLELLSTTDITSVLLTCHAWHLSAKRQLSSLSPLYIGHPHSCAFTSAVTLHAPLRRAKGCGLLHAFLPLRALAPNLASVMPALTHAHLSGQQLAQGVLAAAVAQLPALRLLDISFCRVSRADVSALRRLTQLTWLSLEGVQMAPARAVAATLGAAAQLVGDGVSSSVLAAALPPSLEVLNLRSAPTPLDAAPPNSRYWGPNGDAVRLLGSMPALLQNLPRLRVLDLLHARLHVSDMLAIADCLRLEELAISWLRDDDSLRLDGDAFARIMALPHLARLTLQLRGNTGQLGALTLAPAAPSLLSLSLLGCRAMRVALTCSSLTGLTRLEVSEPSEVFTSEVFTQSLRCMPHLREVVLWQLRASAEVRLAGDYLMQQLGCSCRQLTRVDMRDVPMHGVGLRPPPPLAAPPWMEGQGWLPHLQELHICASQLLRSAVLHLSFLTALTSLSLHAVPPGELLHCCRLDCYGGGIGRLRQLRELRLLAADGAVAAIDEAALEAQQEPHLHFLSSLTTLEHLQLGCVVSHGACFLHLAPLTALRSLALGGALPINRDSLSAIAALRLPRLEALQLTGCRLAGRGATAAIAGAASADTLLGALSGGGLPRLQTLELGGCGGLSERGLAAAAARLPALQYLRLHQPPLAAQQVRSALEVSRGVKYVEAPREAAGGAAGGGRGSGRSQGGGFAMAWYEGLLLPVTLGAVAGATPGGAGSSAPLA